MRADPARQSVLKGLSNNILPIVSNLSLHSGCLKKKYGVENCNILRTVQCINVIFRDMVPITCI